MERGKAEILPTGAILTGVLPTGTAGSSLACFPRAVLSSHPIGENDRTPPDRLLCPSLLTETAVLTIFCTQESLRLGLSKVAHLCLPLTWALLPRSIHAGRSDGVRWIPAWNKHSMTT